MIVFSVLHFLRIKNNLFGDYVAVLQKRIRRSLYYFCSAGVIGLKLLEIK